MRVRSLVFALIAAWSFVYGCSKNESTESVGKVTIKAIVPVEAAGVTRTVLDIETLNLQWSSDETIQLLCPGVAKNSFYPFTIAPGTLSSDGKSASFTGNLVVPDGYLVAAFAGGANGDRNKKNKPGWYSTQSTNSTTGLRFPHIQVYSEDGPKSEYLYMIADPMYNSGLQSISFRHLVSIINIRVKQSAGTPVTLKSVMVQCDGKPISGCFYGGLLTYGGDGEPNYQWEEGKQSVSTPVSANSSSQPSIMDTGEYGDTVVLQDAGGDGTIGQVLSDTPQDFFIVTAPGNHGHLTITLTSSDGQRKSLWVTKNVIQTAAGKCYRFPTLEWSSLAQETYASIIDLINTEQDEDIW